MPKYAILADNMQVAEPHDSNILCIVCKYGNSLIDQKSFHVGTGEVMAIVGGAGTGKTTLMQKMANLHTPMQHTGTLMRESKASVSSQSNQESFRDRTEKVSRYIEQLANLGKIRPQVAVECI